MDNKPIKRSSATTATVSTWTHSAGQKSHVGILHRRPLRVQPLPCHECDASIPASEDKQHRRDEFHQLRDVPHRHALVVHPRTMLKTPGWSSISVPPALSHGSIGIRWLWWYGLFSFLFFLHSLRYLMMVLGLQWGVVLLAKSPFPRVTPSGLVVVPARR